MTYQCEVAIRDFSFSDNVTGFGLYLISLKIIFSVSVSFLMFPCSKKHLIRAYLDKVHIFWEDHKILQIFTLLLTTVHTVKSKVKISQNVVAFSEFIIFNPTSTRSGRLCPLHYYGHPPIFRPSLGPYIVLWFRMLNLLWVRDLWFEFRVLYSKSYRLPGWCVFFIIDVTLLTYAFNHSDFLLSYKMQL